MRQPASDQTRLTRCKRCPVMALESAEARKT
jgi:hypothetical protein